MDSDSVYYRQVKLLVRVLPFVAKERCFALKGGTAINLFLRDFPRLSVDIDLVYVPIEDRERSLDQIGSALDRIVENGIWLCASCHTLVDKNKGSGYPKEILYSWKEEHEEKISMLLRTHKSPMPLIVRHTQNFNIAQNLVDLIAGQGAFFQPQSVEDQTLVFKCIDSVVPPLLPKLDLPLVGCASDYSGSQKASDFLTLSYLCFDPNDTQTWERASNAIRQIILGPFRTMSYKGLNDLWKRRALHAFLAAADELNALLLTFAIHKDVEEIQNLQREICRNFEAATSSEQVATPKP